MCSSNFFRDHQTYHVGSARHLLECRCIETNENASPFGHIFFYLQVSATVAWCISHTIADLRSPPSFFIALNVNAHQASNPIGIGSKQRAASLKKVNAQRNADADAQRLSRINRGIKAGRSPLSDNDIRFNPATALRNIFVGRRD